MNSIGLVYGNVELCRNGFGMELQVFFGFENLGSECSVEMLLWVFGLWNFIYSLVDYCWFL